MTDNTHSGSEILAHRIAQLESKVEALDALRVRLNVVITLAAIFGISTAALFYRLWGVWPYIATGKMEVSIQSKQFPDKGLNAFTNEDVRVAPSNPDDPDQWHRWIIRSAPPPK